MFAHVQSPIHLSKQRKAPTDRKKAWTWVPGITMLNSHHTPSASCYHPNLNDGQKMILMTESKQWICCHDEQSYTAPLPLSAVSFARRQSTGRTPVFESRMNNVPQHCHWVCVLSVATMCAKSCPHVPGGTKWHWSSRWGTVIRLEAEKSSAASALQPKTSWVAGTAERWKNCSFSAWHEWPAGFQ